MNNTQSRFRVEHLKKNYSKNVFHLCANVLTQKPHSFTNFDRLAWLPFRPLASRQNESGDFELCVVSIPNVGAMLLVGLDKQRASEPASHASHHVSHASHHVSHARLMFRAEKRNEHA